MNHQRASLLLIVAAGIGLPVCAQADPLANLELELDLPTECPPRAAFFAELERDLEGSQVEATPLGVAIEIARVSNDQWRARVRARDAEGVSERQLNARNCSALIDATSLIVAMLIDPETAAAHTGSNGAAPPHPDAQPQPEPGATSPAVESSASTAPLPTKSLRSYLFGPRGRVTTRTRAKLPRRSAFVVSAWSALDVGSLPRWTSAYGGSLGILTGPWRHEVALGWWWPQDKSMDSPPNPQAGGTFGMVAALGRSCLRVWQGAAWQDKQLDLGPCAAVEAARRSGDGNRQLARPQTTDLWDAAIGAGGYAALALSDLLYFRLNLDAWFPLWQQRFGFEKDGQQITVYRVAAAAGRGTLGLELRFR